MQPPAYEVDPDETPAWSEVSPGDSRGEPGPGERYRVVRRLASGGMGEVFLARDTELNREVALKEMRGDVADDPTLRARFIYEAEATGLLDHPGVAPVYSLGVRPDGRPFYAMKLIRGQNLQDAVAEFHRTRYRRFFWRPGRGPRDAHGMAYPPRAAELRRLLGRFVALARAVAFAHSRGVIHRDIKPANVMLGEYGETLIVDWGLAKRGDLPDVPDASPPLVLPSESTRGETAPGARLGTPRYMSPEQAEGRTGDVGQAADVYGLGAVLYAILTGKPPVGGESLQDVLRNVRDGKIVPPRRLDRRIDRRLEAICLKALALRPEDRYATAAALADDVDRWLLDLSVSAYREYILGRFTRWFREQFGSSAGWLMLSVPILLLMQVAILLTGALARNAASRLAENPSPAPAARPGAITEFFDKKIAEDRDRKIVQLLRQAIAAGMIRPGDLDKDPGWYALRYRQDFRALRRELGLPDDPLSPDAREILDLP